MQRCNSYNIILRALSAVALALGLVLIPLSQAEATSCSDLSPGGSSSSCGSWCETVSEQGGYRLNKLLQITITRAADGSSCTTNEVCGGGSCWFRIEPEEPLIIEPEPKKSAKPKKRRR